MSAETDEPQPIPSELLNPEGRITRNVILSALRMALAKHFPDFKQEVLAEITVDDLRALLELFMESSKDDSFTSFLLEAAKLLTTLAELPPDVERSMSIRRCFRLVTELFEDLSLNAIGKFRQDVDDKLERNFFLHPFGELAHEPEKLIQVYGPVKGQIEVFRRMIESDPDLIQQHVQGLAKSMYEIGKNIQPFYFQAIRDILTEYNEKEEFYNLEHPAPPPIPKDKKTIMVEGIEIPVFEPGESVTRKKREAFVRRALNNEITPRQKQEDEFDAREVDTAYRCSQMMLAITHWLAIVSKIEQSGKNISSEELLLQHQARHEVLMCGIYLRQKYYSTEEVLTLFQFMWQDLGLAHFMNLFLNQGVKTFLGSVSGELVTALSYLDNGREVELPSEAQDRQGVDFIVKPLVQPNQPTLRGCAIQVKTDKNQKRMVSYEVDQPTAHAEVVKGFKSLKPQQKIRYEASLQTLKLYAKQQQLVPVWVTTSSGLNRALEKFKGSAMQIAYQQYVKDQVKPIKKT